MKTKKVVTERNLILVLVWCCFGLISKFVRNEMKEENVSRLQSMWKAETRSQVQTLPKSTTRRKATARYLSFEGNDRSYLGSTSS